MNNTSQESQILTQATPDFAVFQEQLATFTAPDVPYFNRLPQSPHEPIEVRPVAVPDVLAEIDSSTTPVWDWQTVLFTAFAVYLARLCQTHQLDLGFKPLHTVPIEDGSAIHIPLRLTLDLEANFDRNYQAVERQLDATMHHFQDWCAQFHNIYTPPSYSIVIAQVQHPHDYQPLPEVGLTLLIASTGDVLWLYNLAQLSDPQGLQMLKQFTTLQESLATQWEAPIWKLPLLNATERHQLLIEWNNTATPYPADKCIHQLFEEQVERTPDLIAVVFEEKQLTYQELNQRANQLAHHLQTLGVGPDRLVGICVERSLDMIVGILGIWKAGGAYVPLDPNYPKDRLTYMLTDSQVSVLLTQPHLRPQLPPTPAQIVCLEDFQNPNQKLSFLKKLSLSSQNLAYVMYTSGSTGRPKGVLVQHDNVVAMLRGFEQVAPATTHLKGTSVCPFSFDVSVWEIFSTLSFGGTLHILDFDTLADPNRLVNYLVTNEITSTYITPAFLKDVVTRLEAHPLPIRLERLLVGVEPIEEQVLQRYRQLSERLQIVNGYGPTETTICATFFKFIHTTHPQRRTPIGVAVPGYQVYVMDNYLQPVPVGVSGELYIGGAGVARGYLNQPALTGSKFIPNPFGEGRLYKTGDLVRWLPEKNIEFIGRVDQQVKLRGFRIELGEIEATLTTHPAVRDAVVMLREDPQGDPQLTAYLIPTSGDAATQNEHVQQWQNLYEETYGQNDTETDLSFNIKGWNSSYTGEPISAEEMAEWVEDTVAELQALSASNILEIGCGTGLLLAQLAPHCDQYWGLDYSQQAITQVQRLTQTLGFKNVTLQQRVADDVTGIPAQTFDLVIINSVVQHFPSLDYLQRVIEGALQALKPGGTLYLGDIRNFTLLEAYHASVQLYRASDDLTRAELAALVQQYMRDEEELLVAPAFFYTLPHRFPQIQGVEVRLKRGHYQNELTRFRYQVLLQLGQSNLTNSPNLTGLTDLSGLEFENVDWQQEGWHLPELRSYLSNSIKSGSKPLLLHNVPNARIQREMRTLAWLAKTHPQSASEWRQQVATIAGGIDPETLWALGEELSYQVHVTWSEEAPGRMTAAFYQSPAFLNLGGLGKLTGRLTTPPYANNPLIGKWHRLFVPQLREYLQAKLPDYMIPAAWVTLEALPMLPNGKVDRKALPAPTMLQRSTHQQIVLPRSATEETITQIWRVLLGQVQIGIHDDFYELGGHSLLATQIVSRLRTALQVEIPLNRFLKQPTVAALAQYVETIKTAQTMLSQNENQPANSNEEEEIW